MRCVVCGENLVLLFLAFIPHVMLKFRAEDMGGKEHATVNIPVTWTHTEKMPYRVKIEKLNSRRFCRDTEFKRLPLR